MLVILIVKAVVVFVEAIVLAIIIVTVIHLNRQS